jgi:hypothetical protein
VNTRHLPGKCYDESVFLSAITSSDGLETVAAQSRIPAMLTQEWVCWNFFRPAVQPETTGRIQVVRRHEFFGVARQLRAISGKCSDKSRIEEYLPSASTTTGSGSSRTHSLMPSPESVASNARH